ncbi:tripartite tricarboxylate transporter substrate binding protein [Campylobacter sp. MIT 21-1685]|uniref:Bug family tripartite tricarboxylate transporter substrate binding protein n=1 Tax=unclassified Campylobacter TaxID=2593542 RepID=UPI00224B9E03|nr:MULTISPECIES: tripartite tricarboxylate transporter substrate binding protein [unclassified Campylobacter]MCX2683017.1 tripartite tricarboxylate transporter substrate binding protein [Campylobacter sp. MIT 21-1684]MCX2751299.1 tripartite tricarboxylate transporter substrate binding protein [Campylobacter sp. MIT 21-1682]MCX2807498.1 tripartite tricarboxylate transporter substrate binding protein [Campylobacter sp. MIT 21-1685]
MTKKLLFFLTFCFSIALAKEPVRPECIAPAQPGGGFDLTCKLAQAVLVNEKFLSKPMRVTYMPGGVGVVAYNSMINSKAKDSNIIVAFSSGTLLNIATGKHGKYNENDVRWLSSAGIDYSAVAVRNDSPYQSLENLLNTLKKNPQAISFGAAGSVGGQDWMVTALLAKNANIDIRKTRYVAFEGGGDVMISLLGGHVDAAIGNIGEFLPYLESGNIRILALFADERLKIQSEKAQAIPTAKELGFDVIWGSVRGYYMAPKVSDEQYNWWLEAFEKAQQTETFKEQRQQRGLQEFNKNGKELEEFVKTQTQQFRSLAKEFNLIK